MWVETSFFGDCFELKKDGLRALVSPEMGMALVDFFFNGVSIFDTDREDDFLAYRKGLGPLILPHFNQDGFIPDIAEDIFPHVAVLKKHGVDHPFQHGIGRYVPWRVEGFSEEDEEVSVTGIITGNDSVYGRALKTFVGFDFIARVSYRLTSDGLFVAFDVRGEEPVVTGIHYYYDLVDRNTAELEFTDRNGERQLLRFNRGYDDIFIPGNKFGDYATCTLKTDLYKLETVFKIKGEPEEIFESLVIFSPEDEGFVCIEPLSYNPRGVASKTYNCGVILLKPVLR